MKYCFAMTAAPEEGVAETDDPSGLTVRGKHVFFPS
jgi:hypothetical protein